MLLNKLENFIKNTEGRILYVNPNDLDATDGIENEGNSLTKPFKTIQRALIESARFSYIEGNDNDIVEKTTILCFPGEHLIDNRPGFGIKTVSGDARAVKPDGGVTNLGATETFSLTLNSNFDLTQEDNILYKFNSVHGGVIIPRGTSLVGLDLRKTKIRPKYVPNPTDPDVPYSSIFKVTGTCYFWQFTLFDGDESTTVYTDHKDFSDINRSKPTFSHHKLTCFEYADGVNVIGDYQLTDLQVYYSKLSNAFNRASTREVRFKYPTYPNDFAPVRPEFEIVGAFATDALGIEDIFSGDGNTAGSVVTVTTKSAHGLSSGTPIKIKGVSALDYNISTKVKTVIDENRFTYLLSFVKPTLPAGRNSGLGFGEAEVLVETDTVTGASPYIFNCSLRSVFGMQGMHADGSKATGFKSMVVAQFTGVSLQKDDRAFLKFNETSRQYAGLTPAVQKGETLAAKSSSTNIEQVYHLDSGAVYRPDWETTHVKVSNDAVIQIVSVFAIGYHTHFRMLSGADASVTNSNSNFGQFALAADGFKERAFAKDNKGFVTSIITPRAVVGEEQRVDWLQIDKIMTEEVLDNIAAPVPGRLYLLGSKNLFNPPSSIAQGFRIGSRVGEKLYVDATGGTAYEATIVMSNGTFTTTESTSEKSYKALHSDPVDNVNEAIYTIDGSHELKNGESIRIISDSGELPAGLQAHQVYYAITKDGDSNLGVNQIKISGSKANADLPVPEFIRTSFTSAEGRLTIVSRISDKSPGELGHPIQFDDTLKTVTRNGVQESGPAGWFVHVSTTATNTIYSKDVPANDGLSNFENDDEVPIPYVLRKVDDRSLDEKIYKVRYVIPKEVRGAKDPTDGFILQESSSTGVTNISDFTATSIGAGNPDPTNYDPGYNFNKNLKLLTTISYDVGTKIATVRTDQLHGLKVGNKVTVRNVTTTSNPDGLFDKEFNGVFVVASVINDKTFTYKVVELVDGEPDDDKEIFVGTININTNIRTTSLPRIERNDTKENLYVYRSEVITPYEEGIQDGIYHLFVLNGNNSAEGAFASRKYNQSIVDLYPQHDRDNLEDNPPEANTFAPATPIGSTITNDLKKSITRETANKFLSTFDVSNTILTSSNGTTETAISLDTEHQLNGVRYYNGAITVNNAGGQGDAPVNGTYYNVKLFDNSGQPSTAPWKGATVDVVVDSSAPQKDANGFLKINQGGSGYKDGDTLFFDSSLPTEGGIGGTPICSITLAEKHISIADNNYVQVTGITTATDGYYMIKEVSGSKTLTLHKHTNDVVHVGQQIIDMGPALEVSSASAVTGTSGVNLKYDFTSTTPHGLVKGNRFRILSATYENLGDFIVDEELETSSKFSAVLGSEGSSISSQAKYILKHGMSSHEGISGKSDENLGARSLPIVGHDVILTGQAVTPTDGNFTVTLYDGTFDINDAKPSIEAKFPLGSYLQAGSEIMRVTHSTLQGSGNNELYVIRGALGTNVDNHKIGAVLRRIQPKAMEVRRPSILRASGHTFEYLGYGPGNYSTGLPQISDRTLTEREEFLAQSQETSCGTVVYTGMNDKGDFYIGNTKISADSGQQTTFDIPIPTVTGEDPSKLSVVFDEVIVKERLLVEGGTTKQILSQFNGPVTFNGITRFTKDMITNNIKVGGTNDGVITINNQTDVDYDCSTNKTNEGVLVVKGGATFHKKVSICGTLGVWSTAGISTFMHSVDIDKDLTVGRNSEFSGITTFKGGSHFPSNQFLSFGEDTPANAKGYIYHDAATGLDNFRVTALGPDTHLYLQSDEKVILGNKNNTEYGIVYNKGGDVELFYGGGIAASQAKLLTQATGVKVQGQLDVTQDIIAFSGSDRRLKDNIVPIPNALEKVISISGNTFNWNSASSKEGKGDTGVIAQEIEALGLPGLTTIRDDGTHAVAYEKLVPLLIEAVKDLAKTVSELEHDLRFKK
tara:strand:+ start:2560 stop:8361 length:5802 start_codon:yes stop_codon:yes gene_type:complete